VNVDASIFASNARAGLAVFATDAHLANSWLDCNPIHLNGEMFEGCDFELNDDGGNTCLCDTEIVPCKVLSTNLEPPPVLP
jgi:hypothetical protein